MHPKQPAISQTGGPRYSRRRLKRLLVSIGMVATAAFAVNSDLVGAVFAFDGADGNCGSSDLCFWDHNDGQGGIGDTVWADDWYINNGFWGQGSSADNRTDSYKNSWNTKSVTMYEHKYYNDGNPGWTNCRVANHNLLLNYTAANDNEQSSHKNATGTGFC